MVYPRLLQMASRSGSYRPSPQLPSSPFRTNTAMAAWEAEVQRAHPLPASSASARTPSSACPSAPCPAGTWRTQPPPLLVATATWLLPVMVPPTAVALLSWRSTAVRGHCSHLLQGRWIAHIQSPWGCCSGAALRSGRALPHLLCHRQRHSTGACRRLAGWSVASRLAQPWGRPRRCSPMSALHVDWQQQLGRGAHHLIGISTAVSALSRVACACIRGTSVQPG